MTQRHERPDVRALIISVVLLVPILVPAGSAQGIAVDPGTITFNSTTGAVTVNRTVIVCALDNVTELQVISRDLYELGGSKVIPREAILATVPSLSMTNGSLQTVPISFDLGNVSAGLYSGDVWLNSSPGGVTKVPVTATIRADWLRPLALLIAGLLVSFALFTYGTSMKRRDEIQVATGFIKERARSDRVLTAECRYGQDTRVDGIRRQTVRGNAFCSAIRQDIAGVMEQLSIGDDKGIEAAYSTLQTDWGRWNRDRSRLKALFISFSILVTNLNRLEQRILNCGIEVMENIPPIDEKVPYIDEMRLSLQRKFNDIVLDKGDDELEKEIKADNENYLVLVNLVNDIRTLENSRDDRDEETKNPCKTAPRKDLWKQCKDLAGQTEANSLHDAVEAELNPKSELALTKGRPAPPPQDVRRQERAKSNLPRIPPGIGHVPRGKGETGKRTPYDGLCKWLKKWFEPPILWLRARSPGIRIGLFKYATYAVTVLILALVGFSQLYLSNPTFGAVLGDWITLALWGLIAGAAADTISKNTKTSLGFTDPGT